MFIDERMVTAWVLVGLVIYFVRDHRASKRARAEREQRVAREAAEELQRDRRPDHRDQLYATYLRNVQSYSTPPLSREAWEKVRDKQVRDGLHQW